MNNTLAVALSVMCLSLSAVACEDDPEDLDYLKQQDQNQTTDMTSTMPTAGTGAMLVADPAPSTGQAAAGAAAETSGAPAGAARAAE